MSCIGRRAAHDSDFANGLARLRNFLYEGALKQTGKGLDLLVTFAAMGKVTLKKVKRHFGGASIGKSRNRKEEL